jgi:hypothetical protein
VTGTGFTYNPVTGAPTAGAITNVQLFTAANFELAAFMDVSNAPLATFHTTWRTDDDPNGVSTFCFLATIP